ncbi:hypothetical protein RE432_00590 [Pusillimonas sp. SM2304]|uniref:hypothetical protein n=1 Tax=Pusillimonas sp. SM2304 TaxID=3073241 RepID=UPI002874C0D5|nr:hypothetical protein [Pusillimonas sp. SM2304]MDS1138914.1 hypothetical protein [Pusillimonas sp. SM2304]
MHRKLATGLLLLSGLLPLQASASEVIVNGKITSRVTAFVKAWNNLFVTDAQGGWFDQGLVMQQLGAWDTPYEVQARLRIVSSSGIFQVRLDTPVQIRNSQNAALVFRQPKVTLGAEGLEPKTLAVGLNTEFKNPPAPNEDEDSVGYYALTVSAYPPEGNFRDTAGAYSGELSMTFEPVAVDP